MIPIDFILNFQVTAASAMNGIKKMSSATEQLAKTAKMSNKNFEEWWGKSMPSLFKSSRSNMLHYREELKEAFNTELLNRFGGELGNISHAFKVMYHDANNKVIQNTFDSLSDTMSKIAPHIESTQTSLGQMFDSLIQIRKSGAKGIEDLSNSVEKINKSFKDFNEKDQKKIQDFYETFAKSDKSVKNIKDLNKELDAMIAKKENIEKLKKAFSSVFGFSPTIDDLIQKIARASGAFSSWDDALSAQAQMVDSIQKLGISANNSFASVMKSTGQFSDSVIALGASTQVSMKEATEAMSTLLNMRVTNNIEDAQELGKTVIQMGQAFGMSTQEAGQFIKSLYKIGGLSKAQVGAAANAMANVQANLGLTAQEASAVASQVGSMARTMKVFGGRVGDVKTLTTGVAKLNVAFEKAGLSASEANDMLTKMLDPDKLEENILLYQGLGMSASDAIGMMTGDTSKLGDMDAKMVKLAKSLKEQYGGNVFALKEMAAQYGMSLEQVQQLSTLTSKDLEMKKKETTLAEAANKSRAAMSSQWKQLMDTLNIIMQAFVMPLVNLLTWVLKPITLLAVQFGKIYGWADKFGGVFATIVKLATFIAGGLLLAFLLGVGGSLTKMLPLLNGVGGALGGIKNGLGGIVKGAKDAVSNLLKLGKSQKGLGGEKLAQPRDAKGRFTKNPAASVGKKETGGFDAFVKSLNKVDPVKILALGAAILLIAAGIALIALAAAQLAKSMENLNLVQVVGLIGVMAVIMGGMVLLIYAMVPAVAALGAAGTAGAIGLLAFGAAILMVGIGISLIVLSVAHLVEVMANSTTSFSQLGTMITGLVAFIAALEIAVLGLAGAMMMIGASAVPALAGLAALSGMTLMMLAMIPITTALGNAFNNMGTGIKNMSDYGVSAAQSLTSLKASIDAMGGNFSESFVKQLGSINAELQKMSLSSVILGAGASLLKGIIPEKSDNKSDTGIGTDRVANLIAESNSYLSVIMDNTDKIVKILSSGEKETKQASYTRTYTPKSLINKES